MTDQIVRSAPTLAVFDELSKGASAPSWLRDGVVAAWSFAADTTVTLITVSENATFLVREHGNERKAAWWVLAPGDVPVPASAGLNLFSEILGLRGDGPRL